MASKRTLPFRTEPFRYIVQRHSAPARPSFARYRCLHVTSVDPKATLQTAVVQDHAELKRCYDEYKAATADDGKTRWGNAFVWGMTRHALGEELVVYPALDKYLGEEGRQWAAKDRKDAQHLKESLYGFDHMSLTNPHREVLVDILWGDFAHHARQEEEIQLPKLESVLGGESERLARSFERTKRFTATRSHPLAPNMVPLATAAAFMAAPIDKLRDIFRSWPEED
ncbi:hypothetical protein W97_05348 [Coniosporium apollinis CBS 100218]|uniref:Hemerythrin-like domain-containing protein n=1 Tax=Coniosporium apollinis (strain CBS 100218) TaxID=1168221 RepID=R7YW21_CONA1|nr:uncharacterized protein W97_05348 [Coniosporium apollinis CBS 100218]EON66105.1 hypothetical protein W97_05348 [Coniosporium apollinis CBS 100218]